MSNKIKTYSYILKKAFELVNEKKFSVIDDEFSSPIFLSKDSGCFTNPAQAFLFVGSQSIVDEINTNTKERPDHFNPMSHCEFHASSCDNCFTVSINNHIGDENHLVFSSGGTSFIWSARHNYNEIKDTNTLKEMIDDVRYFIEYCYDYFDCGIDGYMRIRRGTIRRAPYLHIKKMLIQMADQNLRKMDEKILKEQIAEIKVKIQEDRAKEIAVLSEYI